MGACEAAAAQCRTVYVGPTITPSVSGTNCTVTRSDTGGTVLFGPLVVGSVTYSCPANATLSGTTCTCNANFEQQGSACISQQEALCAGLDGHTTYASAPGRVMPGSTSCSAVGCQITYGGTVIMVKNAQGQTVTEGDATITSTPCTYSSETGAVESACPGGTEGQINGVTVCVPHDTSTNVIETVSQDSSSSSDVDENGDPKSDSTTSTTKTTICTGNSCSTTTTTNYSGSGGSGTKTDTKTESKADFCRDNPKSSQCQEGGKFTGSCTGNFTCTGDAVQCALTKEVHLQNCKMNKETPESQLYEQSKDAEPDLGEEETVNVGPGDFSTTPVLGAGACISNRTITVMGSAIEIPFSDLCQYLAMLGNVLMAVAWLLSARIVMRG